MSEHQLFYPVHPVDPVCFGLNVSEKVEPRRTLRNTKKEAVLGVAGKSRWTPGRAHLYTAGLDEADPDYPSLPLNDNRCIWVTSSG
jgi:hypothetical protein